MEAELRQAWIDGLLREEQCRGRLRCGDAFCALGVLASECVKRGFAEWDGNFLLYHERWASVIPRPLAISVNLTSDTQDMVLALNDSDNKTFPEIAEWIKCHVPSD